MPINKKYLADFQEECVYHIYNRTNNKESLFLHDGHRVFFLKRYAEILFPFIQTYCWNLLPNHFHFMVKLRSAKEITKTLSARDEKTHTKAEKDYLKNTIDFGSLIETCFKRFFQSYAQAFNQDTGRSGNLFYKPYKRVLVESDSQFTQNVIYIHANALKHGIVSDFREHKWSSWHSLLSNGETKLLREELFEWFGGKERFIQTHLEMVEYYYTIGNEPE